jgi:hypothetical protein
MSPFHDAAISFARYQGAIDPQVVAVTPQGLGRAIARVAATSWSADRAFTPDHQHTPEHVRDIEVQLDDIGSVLWANDYSDR